MPAESEVAYRIEALLGDALRQGEEMGGVEEREGMVCVEVVYALGVPVWHQH